MINDVIKPGYSELKAEWLFRQTAVTPATTSGSAVEEG
jgi:adenosine deaminase